VLTANITPKIIFPNFFNIKYGEFDADFESVKKVAKKFTQREFEG
jgi:hypothetical protein